MGLYDELLTEEEHVRCPGCGQRIHCLQTKSLSDPCLEQHHLGDEIKVSTPDGLAELVIEQGRILGYESCRVCGAWSDWYAVIEQKRWVRAELADWHASTRPVSSQAER